MSAEAADASRDAVSKVATESYGRLVATLAARLGDLAAAEDALGDALADALLSWPRRGIPENPAAWLLVAARRNATDAARRAGRGRAALAELERMSHAVAESADLSWPDERLKLLMVCAHPAIDSGVRTPLMLQVIFRLEVAAIARAYLVSPAAMEQRLVRAKAKIRLAAIPFDIPGPDELPARLIDVQRAVYAAFTAGRDEAAVDVAEADLLRRAALQLAGWLVELLPDEPECRGLLALLCFSESRVSPARQGGERPFVPLDEQDPNEWDATLIERGERELALASAFRQAGPFQIEAAIQSAHAERRRSGETPWAAIVHLYDRLLELRPTIGAAVARAAAVLNAVGPEAALAALAQLETQAVRAYQPYWVVRANALATIDRHASEEAFHIAIGLTESAATRAFLERRRRAAGGAPAE